MTYNNKLNNKLVEQKIEEYNSLYELASKINMIKY
jgi:hypothetical protein